MSDILGKLNEPQKEAVLDFQHPLLVLAGAGSGKTRVITSKIAYAISEVGMRPWQILAVTFTNKAAREMQGRISQMLPDGETQGLEVRTFHSLGAWLLRRYGSLVGLSSTFTIYDDEDSLQLFASLYPNAKKQELRPYLKAISKAKDRGLDPDSRELEGVSRQLPDFRTRYRAYEKALRESGCTDFADLIGRTNELLRDNPDVRQNLQRRFRLVLVDEYQDSNGSQFELLHHLVGPTTQVVVVGDDDQSIYRFRGAEIRNILHFPEDYPGTRTIKLEENYRSTKSILRIASSVIKNNKGRHEKTIFTNNEDGQLPELFSSLDARDEALRVASLIQSDRNYDSTAVLYRTNAQSLDFETTFQRLGIPYQVIGALRFYDREEVKDVLSILAFILNPKDRISFSRIVNKPARGIGKSTIEKIIQSDPDLKVALETAGLTGKAGKGAAEFLSFIKEAEAMLDENRSAGDFANFIVVKSGIKGLYESETDPNIRRGKLENLEALVNAIALSAPGREGIASFLETITLDNTTLGTDDPSLKEGVKLMTMHTTKGLEFDRVFVTGLEDQMIPGDRDVSSSDDIEEERRLFYVAVTRARKQLYLSYALSRMKWGSYSNEDPSRFLREIPDSYYRGEIARNEQPSFTSHYAYEPRVRRENRPAWSENIFASTPKKVQPPKVQVRKKIDWQKDDRCISPDYGRGRITDVEVKDSRRILRVKFDSGRECRFIASFCNLEKEE